MTTSDDLFGEYSVISYLHPFSGERVNLGVAVWSPWQGARWQFVPDPGRAKVIDADARTDRVKSEISAITGELSTWAGGASPLEQLSRQFRHGLVVTSPQPARIDDADAVLERLAHVLLPPRPFRRKSAAKQFGQSFASEMKRTLARMGVQAQTSLIEDQTFSPIEIAVRWDDLSGRVAWRTASFGTLSQRDQQVTLAKAVHQDTIELRGLEEYQDASLRLAVQLPRRTAAEHFDDAYKWLARDVEQVEVFEDRDSIREKVPALID